MLVKMEALMQRSWWPCSVVDEGDLMELARSPLVEVFKGHSNMYNTAYLAFSSQTEFVTQITFISLGRLLK